MNKTRKQKRGLVMGMLLKRAVLPQDYETYVFDLYGTLVDIHTDESLSMVWEKLAMFYGYYGAWYQPDELKERYEELVKGKEQALKSALEDDPKYAHEASPEIEITEVFLALFAEKGVEADETLAVHAGQFFRILTTEYVRLYPGTEEMLANLKAHGKKIYLLSNAQRIFTWHEIQNLEIIRYFDDILISSDYQTKKPDERFFRILIEKYGLDVKRTLFVGNDSRTDIEGAIGVGLDTFYVNSNISPANDNGERADYVVPDFAEWLTE